MQNDRDRSHIHYLKDDHPRSVSQPGLLENDADHSSENVSRLNDLITKTSELDELTVQGVQKQSKNSAIWIVFAVMAGLALVYFIALDI